MEGNKVKNRRKQLMISLAAVSVLSLVLTGCGKRKSDVITPETESETQAVTETETSTEKLTETESETQKLIKSVDYTSKDGTIKITLPDNTWKVTQDADEMRVFSSGSAAMINITHASTEAAMQNLSVMTTEENLKVSLTKQYSDAKAFEVQSFKNNVINGVNTYRYVVKYNATARMWAYAVTYGIVAADQAYVITGTVTDENQTLLTAVETSVDSFRVLKDETLKAVTTNMISGTTQISSESNAGAAGSSSAELGTLTDYGYDASLYSNDVVNVRLAPGTDADVLVTLNKGDKVTVVGETSGWFKVNINGNVGYVRKDFLVYNAPADTEQTEAMEQNNNGESAAELGTITDYGQSTTLYASDTVNIRVQPGTDSAVVGSINKGSSVTVLGESANWFKVSVGGGIGYISKSFLTSDSSVSDNSGNNGGTTGNNGDNNSGNTGGNTGGNNGGSTGGNTGGSTGEGTQTISGTIISSGMDYLTIQGDDGATYNVYYGEANANSVDGLYDGVYVGITVDNSQTATDGTLYATNVQGY